MLTAGEILEAFDAAQATFEALGDGDVQVGIHQAYELAGVDFDAVAEAASEIVWNLPATAAVSVAYFVGLQDGVRRGGDDAG